METFRTYRDLFDFCYDLYESAAFSTGRWVYSPELEGVSAFLSLIDESVEETRRLRDE